MYKTKSHNNLEVVIEKKNPTQMSWIFLCDEHFPNSKQLQLLARCVYCFRFAVAENLHVAKLFVGNTQNADVLNGHSFGHFLLRLRIIQSDDQLVTSRPDYRRTVFV